MLEVCLPHCSLTASPPSLLALTTPALLLPPHCSSPSLLLLPHCLTLTATQLSLTDYPPHCCSSLTAAPPSLLLLRALTASLSVPSYCLCLTASPLILNLP